MSKNAKNILDNLDGLSAEELCQIAEQAKARAGLLKGDKGDGVPDGLPVAEGDEELVYSAASEVLQRHLGTLPPFNAFRRGHTKYKSFKLGVAVLTKYIADYLRPKGAGEQLKAVRYLCGLIVRERVRRKQAYANARPLDIFAFVDDMQRIGSIVDSQFPGYAESGLLRMLMKKNPDPKRLAKVA